MKHFLTLLCGLFFTVSVLAVPPVFAASPEQQINLTQEEQDFLSDHSAIRVHNETDWPPFNFFKDGEAQGFSIDYMNLLAAKLGLKVKYVSGPTWNEFLGLMKSDDLDVMLNIVKTPEREKYLLYTEPYVLNPNSILSRRETPYDDLEQLFGKTVALPKGFFYEEILQRDFPQIKLHLVKNVEDSMMAVVFGKADAALGELAVFNHFIDLKMMNGLTLSGEVKLGGSQYSELNIATRKDMPLLVSMLRKAMDSLDPEDVKALRQRWIGESQTETSHPKLLLTDAEKVWLDNHKHIRFGADPGYPPFEFVDENGVFSGMSSDYIRLISERLGITMELVPDLSWAEVMSGIKERTVDISSAVSKTPDRDKIMNFTRAHMAFPVVIVTRDDYAFVAGLGDLAGSITAMVKELAVTEVIKLNHPDIIGHMVDTPLLALESVASGNADAVVMNLAVAIYLIKQNGLANLKVAAPADLEFPGLSLGVRKDWPEFVGILDKALASITPEEESAIRTKWAPVSYNTGINLDHVLQAAGVAFIVLIVIVMWNRRLQKEVRQRKIAEERMEVAKNEAERIAQSKTDFIAVVSHEVRTPMNGVLGMARLLREMQLDEEQLNCVDTIVDSGEALINIINDLLDLSKLDADRLETERLAFVANDVVEQAMALMNTRAVEKGLILTSAVADDIPAVLVGDPHRLRQILLNLLSNAIKFTNTGSVTLTAKLVQQQGDAATVTFAITDTGTGIQPDALKKLFSDYTQGAVEVARKYGGTGLGLAICRRLASVMNGEISVESTFGEGSTFRLSVPYAIGRAEDAELLRETAARTGLVPSAVRALRPLKVLQVEDNQTNRAVVERILTRVGHTVITVDNGAKAVAEVKTGRYDAVLMDRHMPVMDGIEATQIIRAMDGPVSSIPIIGITAGASQAEIAACFDAGMNECLIKPVDPAQLRGLLDGMDAGVVPSGDARVLVVDDVEVNRTVAMAQLKKLGCSFALADNGADALEQAQAKAFGMILLDINMPDMDGVEFTKQFRQWEGERDRPTPIIAVTGNVSIEDRKGYLAAGMDDVLTKPVDAGDLKAILQKWCFAATSLPRVTQETVAATQKPPVGAPPINLKRLARTLGEDDEDVLFSILDIFLEEFPTLRMRLDQAIANRDATAVHHAAHAAKGAAANAAAPVLVDLLKAIQDEAHEQDWGSIEARTGAIGVEYDKVVKFCADQYQGG